MGTSPSPEIGLLQPKLTLYFYIWILAIKELKIILYIAIYVQYVFKHLVTSRDSKGISQQNCYSEFTSTILGPPELTNTAFGHPPLLLANLLHILQCQGELTSIA